MSELPTYGGQAVQTITRPQGLHFTVAATPAGGATVEQDVRMVKAALLYGDGVTLCSLGAFMILSMAQIGTISREEQLQFLEATLPVVDRVGTEGSSETLALLGRYREISRKGARTLEDQLVVRMVEALLDKTFVAMGRTMRQQARHAQADDLIAALNTGLIEVHAFQNAGDTDAMVKEYVDLLGQAVSDHATLPLFDEHSGTLIRGAINEEMISVSDAGVARGKHGALAASLLERLPLFDNATVDEILSIRRELEKPLIRFRSAMLQYSEKIKSAAWDTDFPYEADAVFTRDVAPAILNIQEAVVSNNLLAGMARVGDKSLDIAGKSALGMVIAHANFVPHAVAQTLGYGAAGVGIAYDVVKAWRKERKTAEDNQMFFYYRAGRRLEKKVGPRVKKTVRRQGRGRRL